MEQSIWEVSRKTANIECPGVMLMLGGSVTIDIFSAIQLGEVAHQYHHLKYAMVW